MGNEESKEIVGEAIQTQGEGYLWSIDLTGREKDGVQDGEQFDMEGCCVFSRTPGLGTEATYCRAGVEHMRLLRHPNILKFLGCDPSPACISMVTEPVIPVLGVLEETSAECIVMGWRGVANGLTFLHTKVGLSHNNLSMLSVYASTNDSQWKIGGFEFAFQHKKIDAKFISSIASLRYKKAIPPEDKSNATPTSPCHARDVWGFGNLILATLDKANLNDHVGDTLFQYVHDNMLNPDPIQRPTASQVAARSWMRNQASQIFDFLSNLTLKKKPEKDKFFGSLAEELFSLPPLFIAEHLVPLIVNPLVMAEPLACSILWRHLLTPVTQSTPRPKVFDENRVCPLLDEELFVNHVIPLILNLFESRELHVRIILLENLGGFAPICDQEDLMVLILPEVLLGLKDCRVEVIQATLHALGDIVPLVGAEAVLGSSTEQLFLDSRPRSTPLSVGVVDKPTAHLALPASSYSPSNRDSKEERQQRMKVKREQQKLKRQAQQKLGKLTGRLGQRQNSDDEDNLDETTPLAPPTTDDRTSQYSPSISHDEKEESWEGTEEEEEDLSGEDSYGRGKNTSETGFGIGGSKKLEDDSEEWEEFEDGSVASGGGGWGDPQIDTTIKPSPPIKTQRTSSTSSSRSGGMKLKTRSKTSSQDNSTSSSPHSRLKVTTKDNSDFRNNMKGRLSEQDLQRLELQATRSTGMDFFADMEPALTSSSPSLKLPGSSSIKSTPSVGDDASSGHSLSSAMQYQPHNEEGEGWGDDGGGGWDDF